MKNIGVVAGSFDPITNGHLWLIEKAAELLGEDGKLYVVIGVNPSKKYHFIAEERENLIKHALSKLDVNLLSKIEIHQLTNDLLINFAKDVNASYIFRGIRNTEDFNYESQIQQVNRAICPDIETVFFIPPSALSAISSSTVKGLVGFNGWEHIVLQYVHPKIVDALKTRWEGKSNVSISVDIINN